MTVRSARTLLGGFGWVCQALLRTRVGESDPLMILPQVHLRKPCYDFYFL